MYQVDWPQEEQAELEPYQGRLRPLPQVHARLEEKGYSRNRA